MKQIIYFITLITVFSITANSCVTKSISEKIDRDFIEALENSNPNRNMIFYMNSPLTNFTYKK